MCVYICVYVHVSPSHRMVVENESSRFSTLAIGAATGGETPAAAATLDGVPFSAAAPTPGVTSAWTQIGAADDNDLS